MQEKIKEMTERGFSARRIASKCTLDFKDVQQIIKDNKFDIKKEYFNEDLIEHIISLYKDGVSAKNLGIKYSIDKRRIQRWVKEKGVMRSNHDARRFTFFDECYFDDISTAAKAYWLGFFYADAYNNKSTQTVSVSLADKDRSHLIKLAQAINLPKSKIKLYNSTLNDQKYPACTLRMYSKHMCDALEQKGCPQAKSFIIKYPEWLRPELNNHFIRGIFDGDGCLTKRTSNHEWKLSIVSTSDGCKAISDILYRDAGVLVATYYISQTEHNTYELQTNGNEKITKIMKWLYEDSTHLIRLNRKYDKFEELIDQQNSRRFSRENYKVSDAMKDCIIVDTVAGDKQINIANKYNVHLRTVAKINQKQLDQNSNLKPVKKIWIGELNFPQTNNISNDINTLMYNEHLIWKGNKLTNKYLRTVDEDFRDEIAKDIFNFFTNYDFAKFRVPKDKMNRAWESIKKFQSNVESVDGAIYVSNAGTTGHDVYKSFFPNIIKVKGDGRPSIYDVLMNKETLWATIRNRIGNTLLYNDDRDGVPVQYPMDIHLGQLIIGAKNSGLSSMGSIFKSSVAKAIYQKWVKDGFNVLDYSCGFGTRLLGLMSCEFDNIKYFGYEPNTETYDGLITMSKHFKFNTNIKKCGSEEQVFNEKMDFAFSSPPYFTQEKYSDEPSQCYNKFPEYEDWLKHYWEATVKNIFIMLKDDGVFGINIGNQSNELMRRLETDMNRIIVNEGFKPIETWYMKTNRSHLSGKKKDPNKQVKLEGIFFYRKA